MKCGCTLSKMDKRVSFYTKTVVQNDIGGFDPTWSVLTTVWAQMQPSRRNPKVEADKLENQTEHKMTIRYNATILTTDVKEMRVKFGSRYFFVKSVINIDEEDEFMHVYCIESKKAGTDIV